MTADQSLKSFELINKPYKNAEDARSFVSEIDKVISDSSKEEAAHAATKEDLVREISQSKIDLIKWMFGFWITLVLLMLAHWFFKQ